MNRLQTIDMKNIFNNSVFSLSFRGIGEVPLVWSERGLCRVGSSFVPITISSIKVPSDAMGKVPLETKDENSFQNLDVKFHLQVNSYSIIVRHACYLVKFRMIIWNDKISFINQMRFNDILLLGCEMSYVSLSQEMNNKAFVLVLFLESFSSYWVFPGNILFTITMWLVDSVVCSLIGLSTASLFYFISLISFSS